MRLRKPSNSRPASKAIVGAMAVLAVVSCAPPAETADDFLNGPITGPTLNELRRSFPETWARMQVALSSYSSTEAKLRFLANELENFIEAHRREARSAPNADLVRLLASRAVLIRTQSVTDRAACETYFTSRPISGDATDTESWRAWFGFYHQALIATRAGRMHPTQHHPLSPQFDQRLRQALVANRTPEDQVTALVGRKSTNGLSPDAACQATLAFFQAVTSLPPSDQADFMAASGP